MFETLILIIFIILIITYKLNYKSYIISKEGFDNKLYLVNDMEDSQNAANILAKIMIILNKLVDKIITKYNSGIRTPDDITYIKYIKKIQTKLPTVKISETPFHSNYTSYSINKGEELVFCIRNKKTKRIHKFNELLYVAIHEIAHIGCPEIGHGNLFTQINLYLLKKAVCFNLYKYIDYYQNNQDYCGMILTSTILSSNDQCI